MRRAVLLHLLGENGHGGVDWVGNDGHESLGAVARHLIDIDRQRRRKQVGTCEDAEEKKARRESQLFQEWWQN